MREKIERIIELGEFYKQGHKHTTDKILSLFPDISGLEVEEDCSVCQGSGNINNANPKIIGISKCSWCQGSGKVSRPATWNECIEGLIYLLKNRQPNSLTYTRDWHLVKVKLGGILIQRSKKEKS